LIISRCVLNAWLRRIPLRPYFHCGIIRFGLGNLTSPQLQYINPSTVQAYKQWIKTAQAGAERGENQFKMQQLTENIETLQAPSAHIMWLGNPSTAKKVVLFLHGGGYKAPLCAGHLEWCLQAYLLARPDMDVAVALLHYSLAPAAYPTQLAEASAALAHLLARGFTPRDMVVGGDSAGGNLAAALLSHVRRPHPRVDPVPVAEPLRGAFLVSPWVSARTDSSSFRRNEGIDMLSARICANAAAELFHGAELEREVREGRGWAWPVDVEESWLDGLGRVVQDIYVTVGDEEQFRDQGVQYAESVRRRNPGLNVHLDITKGEAHDFIFLEGQSKVVGDATTRMRRWFCSLFPE
jgi:acetyl esterase/lipase